MYVRHGNGYASVCAYNGKFSTSVDGLEIVAIHSDVDLYRTKSYKVHIDPSMGDNKSLELPSLKDLV